MHGQLILRKKSGVEVKVVWLDILENVQHEGAVWHLVNERSKGGHEILNLRKTNLDVK